MTELVSVLRRGSSAEPPSTLFNVDYTAPETVTVRGLREAAGPKVHKHPPKKSKIIPNQQYKIIAPSSSNVRPELKNDILKSAPISISS